MANLVYNVARQLIGSSALDLLTADLQVLLVTSGYTANADHDVIDNGANNGTDPSFSEITASGYARQALAGRSVVADNGADKAFFVAGNVTFPAMVAGQTVAGAILFWDEGADSASHLVAYFDMGAYALDGNALRITWNANGVLEWGNT